MKRANAVAGGKKPRAAKRFVPVPLCHYRARAANMDEVAQFYAALSQLYAAEQIELESMMVWPLTTPAEPGVVVALELRARPETRRIAPRLEVDVVRECVRAAARTRGKDGALIADTLVTDSGQAARGVLERDALAGTCAHCEHYYVAYDATCAEAPRLVRRQDACQC